uniref:Uncharacterized protein n=1 Tax=Anguilla anguilla TaxID=7936 RepID=A0A0E9WP36_ANGAN
MHSMIFSTNSVLSSIYCKYERFILLFFIVTMLHLYFNCPARYDCNIGR